MAVCSHCGATTSPDHSFCLNCGSELPESERSSSEITQETEALPAEPTAGDVPEAGAPAASGGSGEEADSPAEGQRSTTATKRPRVERVRKSPLATAIPALVALAVNVGWQQFINSSVSPESYIYRLFRPAGGWIMSLVPALIAFVFAWTVVDLLMKLMVTRKNERDLKRRDVSQLPNQVRNEPTDVTLRRVSGWNTALLARPVGRRMLWLLQHLVTADAQRAHELIRHQSDLEADSSLSAYRTSKLFIWAMPILGFIGTVLGISLAVGGFSEFLTTNVSIDEIDAVTQELGNVASGLSFAFDTTLLGLLAGLVASVVSSAVQAREERLLTALEELGLRVMENATAIPRDGRTAKAGPGEAGAEFDHMMQSRLEELSTQMDQFRHAVRHGMDGFLAEWGKLPPEVEKVAGDLTGLRETLASAAKSTEKLILETRLLLEDLSEATTHMSTRLSTSIESIGHTVDGFGTSMESISGTLSSSLTDLNQRVQSSESHFREGLANLQQAMEKSHEDNEAAARIQSATEEAVRHLTTSIAELGHTLDGFRETQEAMVPLLSQLSGPLELRLMPTPTARPGEHG